MDGGKVIDAAERFAERGEQVGEQAPDIDGQIIYLDTYRNERNERVEVIVKQSANNIVNFLVSNGEDAAAEQILEVAYQIASEDMPPYEVRIILEQHFSQIRPNSYRIYKIMNR